MSDSDEQRGDVGRPREARLTRRAQITVFSLAVWGGFLIFGWFVGGWKIVVAILLVVLIGFPLGHWIGTSWGEKGRR